MENPTLDLMSSLSRELTDTLRRIEHRFKEIATRELIVRQWRLFEDRLEVAREETRLEGLAFAGKLLELERRFADLEDRLSSAASSSGEEANHSA